MQDRSITLYIPGLFAPVGDPAQLAALLKAMPLGDLSELELLLARAQQQRGSRISDEQQLFSLFGIAAPAGDWPVAAVTRLIDAVGEYDSSYWLRADPVHMQPNRDQVVMFGNRHLNVRNEEMAQLRNEFNQLFAEDGLHLETPVNHRWYLRVEHPPQITTTPLHTVLGQNIHSYLPQGADALHWHKLLSEVQMLFHSSSVNEQRRQRRQPEINSLWMWGGGVLPAVGAAQWQRVWSNEVLSRGLARLAQVKESSLPATAEEWLEQATESGHHLIVFDGIRQMDEIIEWHEFVQELNQSWFAPLLAALKRGDLNTITLITDGQRFELNRKQLGRWWKRSRPFSRYIQE
jgi:hypothetical protein